MMSPTHRLLCAVLATVAWTASCSSTQEIEIESRLSPDGRYRATLVTRGRGSVALFAVVLSRPTEQPDPLGVFRAVVPFESDINRLAREKAVSIRWESPAVLVVSYEEC